MTYATQGTCSREINFDVEDNKLRNVSFKGGCNGNLKGIGKLVEGMDIDEVILRLEGVTCGARPTSCPDQLARAFKAVQSGALIEQNIRKWHNYSSPGVSLRGCALLSNF